MPSVRRWRACFATAHGSASRPTAAVNAVLARGVDDLARVRVPALVHFDLWDGNVLSIMDDAGVSRLSGLVDGERYLYGDPLIDFVSPLLGGRIEEVPDHPLRRGYASVYPVDLDASARRRLAMYRVYLCTC